MFSDNYVRKIINFIDQYYLSDESHWPIKFLKDILSGKKEVRINKY